MSERESDEQEEFEPELELGALDPDEETALDALDAALESGAIYDALSNALGDVTPPPLREEVASRESSTPPPSDAPKARESGSAPRTRPRVESWPSFFPPAPEERNQFSELLTPTLAPPVPEEPVSGFRAVAEAREADARAAESRRPKPRGSEPVSVVTASDDWNPESPTARMPSGGLISSILGQSSDAIADEGALAALRTLPRRAQPDQRAPFDAGDPEQQRARLELLAHLAERSSGTVRARLLSAQAEQLARGSDAERSLAVYRAAHQADPRDRLALRRLRRELLKLGVHGEAAGLFRAEAALSAEPREQSLALAAANELTPSDPQPIAAAQQARLADPSSLVAGLLLAQRTLSQADRVACANALRASAERASSAATRALLWLEAGRTLERSGDMNDALECFQKASTSEPTALGPLLGIQRCAIAGGDRAGAARALATLAECCGDARLAAEFARQRAQIVPDQAAALAVLRNQSSARGLRALARAAEAARDRPEQARALEGWAKVAGGPERGLALLELASLQASRDRPDQARQALREANAAGAPAPLLLVLRDALLRANGDAELLDSVASQTNDDALRAVAKLAHEPGHAPHQREARARQEREALARHEPGLGASITAEVLGFDVAGELGDQPQLRAALVRAAQRWPEAARVGPLLAALDLGASLEASVQQLLQVGQGQPLVTRYLAAHAATTEGRAEFWLTEAETASGEQAAFAATTAGRYLERAGKDPTDAYADALDAVRGYAAAALGLEAASRASADLDALERVHRELASTTESPLERGARRVRLGLLNADNDVSGAARWLELAGEDRPSDAVLEELMIRLSMDQSPVDLAERLRNLAAIEGAPSFARALKLRAAAACELAGQWDEALRLYRLLLAQSPADLFSSFALLSALRQSGRFALLATELERRALLTEDSQRSPLLEDWAAAEQARGDAGRARVVFETLLERDPQHVQALRALQQAALLEHDDARLAALSLRLSETLEEPAAHAAELRVCVRFGALLGGQAEQALLRAEGHVRVLWYALMLEDLALRSGDRTRIYDTLRLLSELLHEPMERAAYALRAAEVMESAAPERAARELGHALLATPQHPLAVEQLARLYRAAGLGAEAAEAFERAAFLAGDASRSGPLFYAAGALFQDELRDPQRALENLIRAAQSDVLFADTFARLRTLLMAAGRTEEHRRLLETRLASQPIEPSLAAELELERAELALRAGDRALAKRALHASVQHDPGRSAAWQALATMHSDDREYRAAAEALVQVAKSATSDEGLADALWRLGLLYDLELPDPRRAEIAFTRMLALVPDDTRPLERLAGLYRREGRLDQALRTFSQLIEMTSSAGKREQYVIARASLLEEMGQPQAAEHELDEARRKAPANMRLLRAQSALYERQADRTALTLHLQRSCHALRAAIELDPGEPSYWVGLCELLRARQRSEGVALVTSMAQALGIEHPELIAEPLHGLGPLGLREAVQRRIVVRGALDPLRDVLREQADAIAPCLPYEGPDQLVQADHDALRDRAQNVVRAVEQLFGVPQLLLMGTEQPVCLPLLDQPLTVGIGRRLFAQASDAERFFLLARAVAVSQWGCTLLVRSVPERLILVLHALWTVVDPSHNAAVLDAHEQARVTRELNAAIPPASRARLQSLITDLMGHDDLNPRRLAASAFDFGSRVALLISADVRAALQALVRMRGRPLEDLGSDGLLELCRTDPALRALLSFAISEIYLDARREQSPLFAQDPA